MKRTLAFLLLISCFGFGLERQSNADYRARREALAAKAKSGIVLVFADTENSAGDAVNGFRQSDDFYYLTGVTIPGAAVLIAPAVDPSDAQFAQVPADMRPAARGYSEALLLPPHSPQERWTGKRLGSGDADAPQQTGFERVISLGDLDEEVVRLSGGRGTMLWVNEDKVSEAPVEWLKRITAVFARDVKPLVHELRAVKSAGEMDILRKAISASMASHRAAMKMMKPGLNEHDVAAQMTYEFLRNGCERPAYAPIVGAGFNSTVLHYSADDQPITDGDVVVLDVAGEYSMYASDITRTLPANGHFTPRQREIYDIVLGAQQAAINAFQSGKSTLGGNGPDSLVKVARDYLDSHGKDKNGKPLGQYFIHGLGHGVGLNVHDPLPTDKPLMPGMVFTIEPGLYIPDEKLGVRIEDMFWVDPSGKLVRLTDGLARTADEVEKAMSMR